MNEPTFESRAQALEQAERAFLPAGTDWELTGAQVTWSAAQQLLRRFGALPSTLHFGATELDLAAGEVRFVDQDHRDGGDFLVHRAALPAAWLERLRALDR